MHFSGGCCCVLALANAVAAIPFVNHHKYQQQHSSSIQHKYATTTASSPTASTTSKPGIISQFRQSVSWSPRKHHFHARDLSTEVKREYQSIAEAYVPDFKNLDADTQDKWVHFYECHPTNSDGSFIDFTVEGTCGKEEGAKFKRDASQYESVHSQPWKESSWAASFWGEKHFKHTYYESSSSGSSKGKGKGKGKDKDHGKCHSNGKDKGHGKSKGKAYTKCPTTLSTASSTVGHITMPLASAIAIALANATANSTTSSTVGHITMPLASAMATALANTTANSTTSSTAIPTPSDLPFTIIPFKSIPAVTAPIVTASPTGAISPSGMPYPNTTTLIINSPPIPTDPSSIIILSENEDGTLYYGPLSNQHASAIYNAPKPLPSAFWFSHANSPAKRAQNGGRYSSGNRTSNYTSTKSPTKVVQVNSNDYTTTTITTSPTKVVHIDSNACPDEPFNQTALNEFNTKNITNPKAFSEAIAAIMPCTKTNSSYPFNITELTEFMSETEEGSTEVSEYYDIDIERETHTYYYNLTSTGHLECEGERCGEVEDGGEREKEFLKGIVEELKRKEKEEEEGGEGLSKKDGLREGDVHMICEREEDCIDVVET